MPVFMHRTRLTVDQNAHALHQEGLAAELEGDYDTAQALFATAIDMVNVGKPNTDTDIQTAQIMRDGGFTHVRKAINLIDPNDRAACLRELSIARESLNEAAKITERYAAGTQTLHPESMWADATPKGLSREVRAEHGATLGLLGRLATARAVICNIDTREGSHNVSVIRNEDQQSYGAANFFLSFGSNGYFWVRNSMAGARQERLNGRLLHVAPWLGRAAIGMGWTLLTDRRNLVPATRTAVAGLWYLRSYAAAEWSVLHRP